MMPNDIIFDDYNMEPTAKVSITGFKRINPPVQQQQQAINKFSFSKPKLNVVLVELGGAISEKEKLH